jgi:hypothetical protein
MADINRDDVMIQVRIKEQTAMGEFNDSLYLTVDEFANVKDEDLDLLKKVRVDTWVAFVTAESNHEKEEKTEQELLADKEAILAQKAELDIQIAEIDEKLSD